MRPLLLVGGGGHCRSCIDVVETEGRFRIAGISALTPPEDQRYPFLGTNDELPRLVREHCYALVVVGQIKTPEVRIALFKRLRELGARLPVIVSPRAYVSRNAVICDGTAVMHGAIVNAAVRIGENGIINSMALVEHDVMIGDHCHISTGARLNGGVRIGDGVFVGSGAIIHEGVTIGPRSVVAAGTVVRDDLEAGSCYGGGRT